MKKFYFLLLFLTFSSFALENACKNSDPRFNLCQIQDTSIRDFLASNFASDISCIASSAELENNGVKIPDCKNDNLQLLDNTHPTGGIFLGYTRDNVQFASELANASLNSNIKVNIVVDAVNIRKNRADGLNAPGSDATAEEIEEYQKSQEDLRKIDTNYLEPQTDLTHLYHNLDNNPELKRLINSGQVNIIPVNATQNATRWLQDSMQFTTLDQHPALVQLDHYSERDENIPIDQRIACQIASNCNLPIMKSPVSNDQAFAGALDSNDRYRDGGNLEVFPGGVIVSGAAFDNNDNIILDSVQQRNLENLESNSSQNSVVIDTSFLHVGHVDEIYNSLKISEQRRIELGLPPQCNFVILEASPKRALEIIDPMVVISEQRDPEEIPGLEETDRRRAQVDEFYQDFMNGSFNTPQRRKSAFNRLHSIHIPCKDFNHGIVQLLVQGQEVPRKDINRLVTNRECIGMSGLDLSRYKWEEDEREENLAIQTAQDNNRQKLLASITSKTGCETPPVIEVPTLFDEGKSIVPDAVNGVVITNSESEGSRFISPRTFFPPFDLDLQRNLSRYGIELTQVDDLSYHIGSGEVHCGSNTALVCKEKN